MHNRRSFTTRNWPLNTILLFSMIRFFILGFPALLLPALLAAQTCLCCKKQASGQTAFDRKDYPTALKRWQEGLQFPDAAACPELKNLLDKVKLVVVPDRDHDGIPDALDKCPDANARLNRNPNAGCPESINLDSLDMSVVTPGKMVLIKGGTFTMGDLFNEGEAEEKPLHTVTLSDFYLGATEVTFDEFDAFCDATGQQKHLTDSGRGKKPASSLDWYDAVEYCNWLSRQQRLTPVYTVDKSRPDPDNTYSDDPKKWVVTRDLKANGYRLPTEAEWEYAAREGGKKVRYGNGKNHIHPAQIKYDYNFANLYPGLVVEVGSMHCPNALHLYDMSGNVWEWCADWKGAYSAMPDTNPLGPAGGMSRVLRGGSGQAKPEDCRNSYRFQFPPAYEWSYHSHSGFRIAAGISPELESLVKHNKTMVAIQENQEAWQKKNIRVVLPDSSKTSPEGMALVHGGTFDMYDSLSESYYNYTRHSVTLSDFYIGKTEVTFDDFDAFCKSTGREKPSDNGWGRGKHPVINVHWYDAVEYCNWLSAKEKRSPAYKLDKTHRDPYNSANPDNLKWVVTLDTMSNGYRLPTEAEWEYAAKSGSKGAMFGNGSDIADPAQMNFNASAEYEECYSIAGEYRQKTVEVGSLGYPNTLDIYDMSGNVWEWCGDWYGHYAPLPVTNPKGPVEGDRRIMRGGAWSYGAKLCRNTCHESDWPISRSNSLGFRIAASCCSP